MTLHSFPDPTNRRGPARLASLLALPGGFHRPLLGIAVSLSLVGVASADPRRGDNIVRPAGVSDAVLARTILTALDADNELRGVNIVVSVVDRVAVIGGPVASAAISKRAEWLVRQVPGIEEVRNGCFVASGPDPLLKAVATRIGSTPSPKPSMAELPGVLPGSQSPAMTSPQMGAAGPITVAAAPANNTVIARKAPIASGEAMGLLGAPVGGSNSGPAMPSGPDSAVAATVPGKLTGTNAATVALKPGDVLAAVKDIKKSSSRYAKLAVDLNDGVLVISGTAARATDAWDLAQHLRQVPGINRVVVGAVTVK
jgi:hypothetical protein